MMDLSSHLMCVPNCVDNNLMSLTSQLTHPVKDLCLINTCRLLDYETLELVMPLTLSLQTMRKT